MGQEHEFNVRYVRGEGIRISQLSTESSRIYWVSIGMTLGLTASNLSYHFTQSLRLGAEISACVLLVNMLGQFIYLVIVHRRYKAMLAGIGMTEKEMLETTKKVIAEGEEMLEEMKRDAASKLEAMRPKDKGGE
jgi:hypothetical protein